MSPEANCALVLNLYFARRYDKAIQQLRLVVSINPDYWFSHEKLGRAYARTQRFPEAVAELETARDMEAPESAES